MKICVVLASFTVTGVPLAQMRLARAFAEKGHEVDVVIGHARREELPSINGVRITCLGRNRASRMLLPLASYLRRSKPDVVFSAEDHLNAIALLAAIISRSKAKFSCSSRVPPSDSYSNVLLSRKWLQKMLMKAVMRRADVLTCVSEDMVVQYRELFGKSRHVCVYNIVDPARAEERMLESVDEEWLVKKTRPVLVAAGTLTTRKGFSDLIVAVAEVAKRRDFALIILGEGPLRPQLQQLIADHRLENNVKLLGKVDNPLKYFYRSDIFVLSSLAEGLPNVLVEAMMCGCTPVAFDCPTGPREVIQSGKYGYLVPMRDTSAMAAAIEAALDHPIAKEQLLSALKPFSEEAVIKRHFATLGFSSQT